MEFYRCFSKNSGVWWECLIKLFIRVTVDHTLLALCLLLWLKFRIARGSSHQAAFMDNCQTVSHTFYSLIYPVDEENEIAWANPKNLEFGRLK